MHWYLVHTKPRQEARALANLVAQGYPSYLPTMASEALRRGRIERMRVPLFPRYLFVRLDASMDGQSWAPIRSTQGVSRLVRFGADPARVDDALVEQLRGAEGAADAPTTALFEPGDALCITSGPFAGLQAIYQMRDGEQRVMVLLELLSRTVTLALEPSAVHRVV